MRSRAEMTVRRGRNKRGRRPPPAKKPGVGQITTIALMGAMLFFVILFKDSFSGGIARFVSQVAPPSDDLEVPDSGPAEDASTKPTRSKDD